ncbi:hypothetical protein FKM82_017576 [Ascaphus truei]
MSNRSGRFQSRERIVERCAGYGLPTDGQSKVQLEEDLENHENRIATMEGPGPLAAVAVDTNQPGVQEVDPAPGLQGHEEGAG